MVLHLSASHGQPFTVAGQVWRKKSVQPPPSTPTSPRRFDTSPPGGPGLGSRDLLLVRTSRYLDPTGLCLFCHGDDHSEHPGLVIRLDVLGVEV